MRHGAAAGASGCRGATRSHERSARNAAQRAHVGESRARTCLEASSTRGNTRAVFEWLSVLGCSHGATSLVDSGSMKLCVRAVALQPRPGWGRLCTAQNGSHSMPSSCRVLPCAASWTARERLRHELSDARCLRGSVHCCYSHLHSCKSFLQSPPISLY